MVQLGWRAASVLVKQVHAHGRRASFDTRSSPTPSSVLRCLREELDSRVVGQAEVKQAILLGLLAKATAEFKEEAAIVAQAAVENVAKQMEVKVTTMVASSLKAYDAGVQHRFSGLDDDMATLRKQAEEAQTALQAEQQRLWSVIHDVQKRLAI